MWCSTPWFGFETYDSKPAPRRIVDDCAARRNEKLISRDGPVPSVPEP
jgi:hypothetical protein